MPAGAIRVEALSASLASVVDCGRSSGVATAGKAFADDELVGETGRIENLSIVKG
jgi:hypothetical protein